MTRGPSEAERLRPLREALTATGAGIYLATHVAGPLPAEVAAAVRESDDLELRIGRAGPDRAEDLAQRDREARAVLAAVIHASPERIVLTHGGPEALRLVALEALGRREARDSSAPVGTGGRAWVVAVEGLEAPALEALQAVCLAAGAGLSQVEEGTGTLPEGVVLVVTPHVTVDGRVLDVERLGRMARAMGAPLLVDAGLSVGAIALDVGTLGADAVIGAAHRWLLGPEGVGFAWLGSSLGEAVPARLRAGLGPFPRGALLAVARSVGWLLMYAELPWVLERTRRLAQGAYAGLAALPGVRLAARPEAHAALLAWSIESWSARQAADELSHSVFAILDVDPGEDLVRVGVGAWNTEDELRRLTERVAELARHTPASLPRRPSLTILAGRTEDAP